MIELFIYNITFLLYQDITNETIPHHAKIKSFHFECGAYYCIIRSNQIIITFCRCCWKFNIKHGIIKLIPFWNINNIFRFYVLFLRTIFSNIASHIFFSRSICIHFNWFSSNQTMLLNLSEKERISLLSKLIKIHLISYAGILVNNQIYWSSFTQNS